MQGSPIDFWWAIVLGFIAFGVLTGTIVLIVVTNQKKFIVSQRKQLEDLAKSELKYRNLFENSLAGVFRSSLNGEQIFEANSTFLKLFGINSFDELKSVSPLVLPLTQTKVKEHLLYYRSIENFETELQRKDFTPFWVSFSAKYFAEEGHVEGVMIDITNRKQIENALQKVEEKYRILFDELKDAVFVTTPNGKILDCNTACLDIFGYTSKEELLKSTITETIYRSVEERELLKKELHQHGFVKDYEISLRNADGRKLDALVTGTAVRDERGNIIAYSKVFRDVTEKKKLEEQLRHAQKMEGVATLASGIAHDFNNILNIILGYTSILDRRRNDPEKFSQSIEAIYKAVERSANLVKQLLTFARKSDVVLEPVSVNAVIEELSNMLSETFPRIIAFSNNLDERSPMLMGDYNQVHQALLNLCVNARDAMPTGGTITLRSEVVTSSSLEARFQGIRKGDYVRLSVSDTGTGIGDATKKRIFEPFFTTKDRGKGTGLGLSVVYGIVEGHNGVLDVESELGKGTTFHLYFPLYTRKSGTAALQSEVMAENIRGTETILIIEDEELLLELTSAYFITNGYKVLTAQDGAEAIQVYRQNKDSIGAVLSDLGLPKIEGFEVFKKLKEMNPGVKFILASGYLDPNLKSEFLKSGVKDVVHKPYKLEEVAKKIRYVLDEILV